MEVNFCGRYQSWRAPWIVIESSAGSKIACERITAVCGRGGEGFFFSLRLIFSPFSWEGRTGDRAVCTSRLRAATCCNLKWYREQQSRHKSPRQLPNSFSGLEREGWPFTAPVLVYCPWAPCAALTLTSAVCVGLCVKKSGLPVELDLMRSGKMTWLPLAFCAILRSSRSQGQSLFPCQGLRGHWKVIALSLHT